LQRGICWVLLPKHRNPYTLLFSEVQG
jgi:hypothetical protein